MKYTKVLASLVIALLTLPLAACNDESPAETTSPGTTRTVIQGMHAEFIEVQKDGNRWYEIAISVDKDKTFRMPVFFSDNGKLVQVSGAHANALFDTWLKQRAKNVAAFGSIDDQAGLSDPFLAIDINKR